MTYIVADSRTRIQRLATTFPSLTREPGIVPWEPVALDRWAAGGGPSHGEICAARFILAVWNQDEDWQAGRFDLMEALRVWDAAHQAAFLAWVREPWWP